jgi:hypothetical protein
MRALKRLLVPVVAGSALLLVISACSMAGPGRETRSGSARTKISSSCDRFAGPRGRDHGRRRGSRKRPYKTVRRLLRSLRNGKTGCLLTGLYSYRGVARITRPGTTLRAAPGARANVHGTIWIMPSATAARLIGVRLTTEDPLFTIPLKVQADNARVAHNLITGSSSTICVAIGSQRTVQGASIDHNRIRHCGLAGKFDHLIYLVNTRGVKVRWNVLTDNPGGWAVHLYPNADGTLIEHNVMDRNEGGVIFAGDGGGDTSDGNVVRNNAITYSSPRWNVEGSWSGGPSGSGNRAYGNCVYTQGPSHPAGIAEQDGFLATGNTVLRNSPYVARTRGDFRFRRRSPCQKLVGSVARRPHRR